MRREISSVPTVRERRSRARARYWSLSIARAILLSSRAAARSRLIMTRKVTRHVRSENHLSAAGHDFLWSRTNIASNHARDVDARSRIWRIGYDVRIYIQRPVSPSTQTRCFLGFDINIDGAISRWIAASRKIQFPTNVCELMAQWTHARSAYEVNYKKRGTWQGTLLTFRKIWVVYQLY